MLKKALLSHFLFVALILATQPVQGQLVGPIAPAKDNGTWYDARGIANGTAVNPLIHVIGKYEEFGAGYKVTYESRDADTDLTVPWCDGGICRVCYEVSEKYGNMDVPIELYRKSGGYSYTSKTFLNLKAGSSRCYDYYVSNTTGVKFGAASTEIRINTSDSIIGTCHIAYLNDGSPQYDVYCDYTTFFVGMWFRDVGGAAWNYTYRSFVGFDTSDLPDTAVVEHAELYINHYTEAFDTNNHNVSFQVYYCDFGTTITSADWNSYQNGDVVPGIGERVSTGVDNSETAGEMYNYTYMPHPPNGEYHRINVTPENISVDGRSSFCFKVNDETEDGYKDGYHYYRDWSENATYGREPFLNVTYSEGGCTPSWYEINDTWSYEGNTTAVNHENISCNASDLLTLNWSWDEWNWTTGWWNDSNSCGESPPGNNTYYINITWINYSYVACDFCQYNITNTSQTDSGNMSYEYTNGSCNATYFLDYQIWNWTQYIWWVQWDTNKTTCCDVTGDPSDCFTNQTWDLNDTHQFGNYTYNIPCGSPDLSPPNVSFVEPTPNNETVTVNSVTINVSLNETGDACLLDWNGTNESMSGSGTVFIAVKTSLVNDTYTFLAWCNDTAGNLGLSEMRYINVSYSTPPVVSYPSCDLRFFFSWKFDNLDEPDWGFSLLC